MIFSRDADSRIGKIALYGFQIAVGLVALVVGYVQLIGWTDLTDMAWIMVGAGNVLAGVCLLFPRKGFVGAALLVSTTVLAATANIATFVVRHHGGRDKPAVRTSPTAIEHPIIVRMSKPRDI